MAPDESFDWQHFWADLLQGIGSGLLHYDGSQIAQAALMGLEAFDDAQRRRERKGGGQSEASAGSNTFLPWPDMTEAELAAFHRLSQEERAAIMEEAADIIEQGTSPAASRVATRFPREPVLGKRWGGALAAGREPLLPSPYQGLPIGAVPRILSGEWLTARRFRR